MEYQKNSQSILKVQQEIDSENSNIIKFKFLKEFSNNLQKIQQEQSSNEKLTNQESIINNFQNHQLIINQKEKSINNCSQNDDSEDSYNSNIRQKIIKKKNSVQLSVSEKIDLTINASLNFNKKIFKKKIKLNEHMNKIENCVKQQRQQGQQTQIQNVPFNVLENDKLYYNSNGSFKVGKSTIENFINMNIMKEQQFNHQKNGYDQMGYYKRFQRRKRRKRNAFGILEDRLPVQ